MWIFVVRHRSYLLLLFFLLGLSQVAVAQVNVVGTNSDLVLTINSNKYFGMTVSPGPAVGALAYNGNDALDELRSGGILFYRMPLVPTWKTSSNTLSQTMLATNQAALDWCAQHGMLMLFNLNDLSYFSSSDTTTPALLTNLLSMFSAHPGLGMYKNLDEAWWGTQSGGQGTAENLTRGYNVIHQLDPLHLVQQTHAPRGTVADLQPYNSTADVLMIDDYPVVTNGTVANNPPITNTNVSQFGDWAYVLSQIATNQRNFWMVEQIAFSGTTPPSHAVVFPSFQQEKFMAFQAIVNGARGLMFFGGNVTNTFVANPSDIPLGWNWMFWTNVLKPLTLQLSPGSPVFDALVAPDSLVPITMTGAASLDVEFRLRESGTNLFLLATKREGAAVNASFSGLPPWATNAIVLFEDRTIAVTNGALTDTFAQWDVHTYRFDYPNVPPVFTYIPLSRTNLPTATEIFVASAIAADPITWQWRKNGNNISDGGNISGANTPKLTVSNLTGSDTGAYDVIATSAGGSITTAPPAFLQVVTNLPPTFTLQPQSRTDLAGTTAKFTAAVAGTPPFSYQWRKNGVPLADINNVSGSTTTNLFVATVSAPDVGSYDVVVTGVGTATSATATLKLLTYANDLILYEPFAYANIGQPVTQNTSSNWNSNGSGANDLNVAPGNLSYPGLLASFGNSVTNGGAGLGVRRLFGTTVTNGVIYFSALFRMNNINYPTFNGGPTQVAALTGINNTTFALQVLVYAYTNDIYLIGVQKGGSANNAEYAGWFNVGDSMMIIGKYDFTTTPNTASLWINPESWALGLDSEPYQYLVVTNGTDVGMGIDRFNMRQNTASSVPANMQWDELRFGYTWASVTPPSPPAMTITRTDDTVTITWPVTVSYFGLEIAPSPNGPWSPSISNPDSDGYNYYMLQPVSADSVFYRLRQQ